MAYLNITNPTFQHHLFVFRAPGQAHNQRWDIPKGETVCVFAGPELECQHILNQHRVYGIKSRKEALSQRRSPDATSLVYSLDSSPDTTVDMQDIAQIRTEQAETLDDLVAKEREVRTIASAAANQQEQRAETSLEVSVTRDKDANHREAKTIHTVQVSRQHGQNRR